MFCIGVFVGVTDRIAKQQVFFAEFVGVFALDGGVRVACLPDASAIHVFEVFSSVEVEKV